MKKIAIIDVGSNSIRLIIAEFTKGRCFSIIDDLKATVRLSEGMDENQRLRPEKMIQTVAVLQRFKRLCEAAGVKELLAFATAAVRTAANQADFLAVVQRETGLALRVLSGEEEAGFDYYGVVSSLDLRNGLIVDIGGGSTELILLQNRRKVQSTSIPVGAIQLTGDFALVEQLSETRENELKQYLADLFAAVPWLRAARPERIIGIGGSFRNLGKIHRRRTAYPLDLAHNYRFSGQDMAELYSDIVTKDAGQRAAIKGLSPDRQDIIAGAAAFVHFLCEYCRISEIVISGSGVREGLLYSTFLKNGKLIGNVHEYSLRQTMRQYNVRYKHARHVYHLFSRLIEQLQPLIAVGNVADLGKIAKTAAYLHDCGLTIRYYNHQKHSEYIILNSGLNGLTHRELVMSARIASLHRNGDYKATLPSYAALFDKNDQAAVEQLGVLLRLAETLNRCGDRSVRDVRCGINNQAVTLTLVSSLDLELEKGEVAKSAPIFREAFGRSLVIE